ncbi:hypothetical protein BH10ACI2_BH10ACI2_04310 [soil metagenome]
MKTKLTMNAKRILARQTRAIYKAMSQGVQKAVESTEHLCPIDKGDLISTRTVDDDGKGHVEFGIGGKSNKSEKEVDYHGWIEFGTTKMTAQPNYIPGVEAAKRLVKEKIAKING